MNESTRLRAQRDPGTNIGLVGMQLRLCLRFERNTPSDVEGSEAAVIDFLVDVDVD